MKKLILLIVLMILPTFVFANQVSNGKYMWDDLNSSGKLDQDDEVCVDTECFYVIDNDGEKLTMLAKYNLYAGYIMENWDEDSIEVDSDDQLYPKQSELYNMNYDKNTGDPKLPFVYSIFATDMYWDESDKIEYVFSNESLIYEPINDYKDYLSDNGVNANVRLLNTDDFEKLSITYDGDVFKYGSNVHSWLYTSDYFTGMAINDNSVVIISCPGEKAIISYYEELWGIRPVVEIELEELENLSHENDIYISTVELLSKSDTAYNVSTPKIDGLNVELGTMFSYVNDYIDYRVTIINNTDKDYYLNKGTFENSSSFMKYSYEVNKDVFKAHEAMELMVHVIYDSKVTTFEDNMYFEFDNSLIELRSIIAEPKEENPNTIDPIVFVLLALVASGISLYCTRSIKKSSKIMIIVLVLSSVLIIGRSFKSYSIDNKLGDPEFIINFKCNVKIVKPEIEDNMIIPRGYYSPVVVHSSKMNYDSLPSEIVKSESGFILDSGYFWRYTEEIEKVIFKVGNYVPNNYEKSWDVSLKENGNIMAYVVPNSNDLYDLYIVGKNIIYANPDMGCFFEGMNNLRTIENPELFDTSNVEFMNATFVGTNLRKFNLSAWDTSNVIDMSSMFLKANFEEVNFSNLDTSKVENMFKMFYCSVFDGIDLSSWDISNLKYMNYMFENAIGNKLNLANLNVENVETMYELFYECEINEVIVDGWKLNDSVLLNKAFGGEFEHISFKDFDTSVVTNFSYMFCGYHSSNLDLSSFDTSNGKLMSYMFQYSVIDDLDLSNFDTSNVFYMAHMFSFSKIGNLDISNFDTSNVNNMVYMFAASDFEVLDLSNFDTSNVTKMSWMFAGASKLVSLDISSFTTESNPDISGMFGSMNEPDAGCAKLMNIDMRNMYLNEHVQVYYDNNLFGKDFLANHKVPYGCKIIVKDDVSKIWLQQNYYNYTNVVIAS